MVAAPGHSSLSYRIIAILWAIWQGITVYVGICSAQAGVLSLAAFGILAVASLAGTVFALRYLISYPTVTFDEEGVTFQVAVYRKFFPWDQIPSAGLLRIKNKTGNYPALVVVKPGGKPWAGDPGALRFHNPGKLLFLPYDDQVVQYLEEHYGELDFCLIRR